MSIGKGTFPVPQIYIHVSLDRNGHMPLIISSQFGLKKKRENGLGEIQSRDWRKHHHACRALWKRTKGSCWGLHQPGRVGGGWEACLWALAAIAMYLTYSRSSINVLWMSKRNKQVGMVIRDGAAQPLWTYMRHCPSNWFRCPIQTSFRDEYVIVTGSYNWEVWVAVASGHGWIQVDADNIFRDLSQFSSQLCFSQDGQ